MNDDDLIIGTNEYVIDTNDPAVNRAEFARLNNQDALVNTYMYLFPDGFIPKRGAKIIDVACGTCGWIRSVYQEYPDVVLEGIDNNKIAVKHAQEHEATKNKKNVHIHLMDVLQPLDLPDDTYDLVNLRFTVGVFPRDRWVEILKECFRICKPGGIIRLTEGDTVSVAYAPAFHRMSKALIQIGWAIGKSFSEYEVAVGPMLPKFLRDAGFVEDIRSQAVAIDFSAGADAHQAVTNDFTMTFQLLEKHMLAFGVMSKEEFGRTFEEMVKEFQDPEFAGLWYILSFQGRKPL